MAISKRSEIRKALVDAMAADSALQTAIGADRIYHERPPQAITYPCVTYLITSDVPDIDLDEYGIVDFDVQLDVWAEKADGPSDAEGIVDAIDNLFTNWRLDSTSWTGLRMRRVSGDTVIDEDGKTQRPLIWRLRAARKDL